jgi:hypothetical protein
MVGFAGTGLRPTPTTVTLRDRFAAPPWRTILVAWVAARVVVAGAYGTASIAIHHGLVGSTVSDRPSKLIGLLGFDAGWYEGIAAHGYAGLGEQSTRFFPLLPLLTRGVAALPGLGGHTGGVLIVIVNVAALAFVAALAGLARLEFERRADQGSAVGRSVATGSPTAGSPTAGWLAGRLIGGRSPVGRFVASRFVAGRFVAGGLGDAGAVDAAVRRVVVFASLAPPAFVLVMGYAEALFGLFAVCCLAGARTHRWEWAALGGALAALCRPVGVLLIAPVLVEVAREVGWPRRLWRPRPGEGGGIGQPASGVGTGARGTARSYDPGGVRPDDQRPVPPDDLSPVRPGDPSAVVRPGDPSPVVHPGDPGAVRPDDPRSSYPSYPSDRRSIHPDGPSAVWSDDPGWRPPPRRPPARPGIVVWSRRGLAVIGPAIGAGCYLLWVKAVYGDALLPLRVQRQADLHGASSNPLRVLGNAASGFLHGHVGTALHLPWLIVFGALTVVMARRLPACYAVWATLTCLVILTGSNLDSSERYLYSVFPFVFVAADLTARRGVYAIVAAASTVAMFGYAALVFVNAYVP